MVIVATRLQSSLTRKPRTTEDRLNNLAAHARQGLATMARAREEMHPHIPSSLLGLLLRAYSGTIFRCHTVISNLAINAHNSVPVSPGV